MLENCPHHMSSWITYVQELTLRALLWPEEEDAKIISHGNPSSVSWSSASGFQFHVGLWWSEEKQPDFLVCTTRGPKEVNQTKAKQGEEGGRDDQDTALDQ